MDENPIRYPVPLSFAQKGLENLYPNSQIADLMPIVTGFANSIFAFKKDGIALILRMPPSIKSELAREVELMNALVKGGIPAPQVTAFDPTYQNPMGHPFMIMQRLIGRNLFEAIEAIGNTKADGLIRDIAQTLHRIHSIDATALNVMKFSTLQSFIDVDISSMKRSATSCVKNFELFVNWFQSNRPSETTYNKAFIHNDFHGYNIMVSDESVSGIIDWADAVVGEAQVDVAFFSLIAEALGYPDLAKKFIAEYRRMSGLRLGELNFYITAIAVQKLIEIPLNEKRMEDAGQTEKAEILRSIYLLPSSYSCTFEYN